MFVHVLGAEHAVMSPMSVTTSNKKFDLTGGMYHTLSDLRDVHEIAN